MGVGPCQVLDPVTDWRRHTLGIDHRVANYNDACEQDAQQYPQDPAEQCAPGGARRRAASGGQLRRQGGIRRKVHGDSDSETELQISKSSHRTVWLDAPIDSLLPGCTQTS